MIVERSPGAFGELVVNDLHGMRRLWIGGQLQGGCWLDVRSDRPDLASIRPGPLPVCVHTLAWLAAGHRAPRGHGIVLGLGAGEGVGLLLHAFPSLRLTTLELDAALIELALRRFPLLDHWRRHGRLDIRRADASAPPHDLAGPYDFVIIDINDGSAGGPGPALLDRLLAAWAGRADALWLNLLSTPVEASLREVLALMAAHGKPTRSAWPAQPEQGNLVLGTPASIPDDHEIDVFAGYAGPVAARVRARLHRLLRDARRPDPGLRALLESFA